MKTPPRPSVSLASAVLSAALSLGFVPISAAQPASEPTRAGSGGTPIDSRPADSQIDVDSDLSIPRVQPFGAADSSYWGITGGVGTALEEDDDSIDPNLGLTYHYFLAKDFEVIGEIGAWYFAQDGGDAGGINPGFTLRWHFLSRERWSLYADTGIGLLLTTDDVPRGGSSFNFMPRAGAGGTVRIDDRGTRAYLGVRWHHVSNARITGDDRNPDRDGVMVYGGVMFPF